MKISSRIKQILSLSIVSVMAATAMPTLASATPDDYQDNVVTVEVDLGEGPGDEVGCEGFATLELPETTLAANFNGRVLGNQNPTTIDYLSWYWGEGDSFTNEDLNTYLANAENANGGTYDFDTVPPGADVTTLEYITYTATRNTFDLEGNITGVESFFVGEDTDENGRIDGADAPEWLTETRRTYTTDWFQLTYDADDCVDSEDMAFVMVGRGPVENLSTDDVWRTAEADWGNDSGTIVGMASANLRLKTELIGGLVSLPYRMADWPFEAENNFMYGYGVSPVSWGNEGTAEMRAVMNIYGSNPSGVYRTKYYYQLEVNEFDYFEGIPFFGCYLGPCG
jgi:hypothetical protein